MRKLFVLVAVCIGIAGLRASAQAPPQPLITEAFVDAETATLTFNGAGFRAGFPTVYLGNNELPVRWANEGSTATWLPELWPGTYRLIARWPDGSQADFFLTVGAIGPVGPKGDRGPKGPRGVPGFAPAGDASPDAATAADETTTTAVKTTGATTSVGVGALASITATGGKNTAVGARALNTVTTDVGNTAVGFETLIGSTGGSNTAIGEQALKRVTSGENTAIGFRALTYTNVAYTNYTQNIAVGVRALNRSRGSKSIAVGYEALRFNAGNDNIAIGYHALHDGNNNPDFSGAVGSKNIAIGNSAGASNRGGSNNIYIGSRGTANDGSNRIWIGTSGTHTNTFLAGRVEAEGLLSAAVVQSTGDVTAGNTFTEGARPVSLMDLAARVKRLEDAASPTTANP